MLRAAFVLVVFGTLVACGQQDNGSPAPAGGPQLNLLSLHDVEPRGSIDRSKATGLWESEEQEDGPSGTLFIDRIQITDELINFSRKCTFSNGETLVAETIALLFLEPLSLTLEEDIEVSRELDGEECSVQIEAGEFAFSVDEELQTWTLFDLDFKKLSDR